MTERQQLAIALRESMTGAPTPTTGRSVAAALTAASEKESCTPEKEELPEPKKRKMTRVEKELASLAPWAWDPLVGTHAPGTAMMRDFSEVVAAEKKGAAVAYRNAHHETPESASALDSNAKLAGVGSATTPGRREGTAARDDASGTAGCTPAPMHGKGGGGGGGGLSYTDSTARKRVRSPPYSHGVFAPSTATRDTPMGHGYARRATPPTAMGPPPTSAPGTAANAKSRAGGADSVAPASAAAAALKGRYREGSGDVPYMDANKGDGKSVAWGGRGSGVEALRARAITPANLGKALEEAGHEEAG
eukprot:CAMPEP_0181364092 /NCGR_PEP_ID=MMETSP1106-20121128/9165_1 /TAXON_ID=81844 /ORGANISM="Mantoniella antarctica, Strain SL-175" /LENGTH=305 /DNA_ID=CAMNT_0023478709 /DNA_START=181 /DNA_END=1094 /DNA_ORIENTATION=-